VSDYLVVFARSAEKELDSLPVEISSRISPRINALADSPRPPGCVKLKAKPMANSGWRLSSDLQY